MRVFTVLLIVFAADAAWACGGLFCSNQPVDQNAERILFRVHDDDTITAIVEISYSGAAEEFSWVVPVPDVPALGTVPGQTLRVLDQATAVQIIAPPLENCFSFPLAGGFSSADEGVAAESGVFVEELPRVGPFDPVVLDSDDAGALIDWLNDNGYLITEEMEPYVEAYLGAGMKFLGLKLATDAATEDIEPIVMNYPGREPMIPIVLTSVAAEPEMGVLVFIAGDSRFESANYANLSVDRSLVRFNPFNGRNNYFALVSFLVDDAGGRGFVTEFAGASGAVTELVDQQFIPSDSGVSEALDEILGEHAYITRMYTRISGWEMLADPTFVPTDKGDVSNIIDISDGEQIDTCADEDRIPLPCGDTYCGPGASCASTDSGDGCVCPAGSVARAITSPRPFRGAVYCAPENFDLLQSVSGMDESVCAGNPCGDNGACVSTGGFAACSCNEGYAAISLGSAPRCVRANQLYSAAQLFQRDVDSGCGCQSSGVGAFPWLAALFLLRLRRRQSAGDKRTCQRA